MIIFYKNFIFKIKSIICTPPILTAYFCKCLKPGIVFLVQQIFDLYLLQITINLFVLVDIPDNVPR